MTRHTGRRRRIADDSETRMIESRAEPVAAMRVMARTAILCRCQMAGRLPGGHRTVMALRTAGVLWRQSDVAHRPEAAVIDRRKSETATRGVTAAAALGRNSCMKSYEHLRSRGRALNRDRVGRSRRVHETPGVGAVMAGRATHARDSGRGMVHEPADERRRVVTIAAVGSWSRGYVALDLARGVQSIMAGTAHYRMPRQYAVIEHPAHVVTRGGVADIARLSDVSGRGVRIRRRILAGNGRAISHCAPAVMATCLTASARHDDLRIGVIRKRSRESRCRVTGITFHGNVWMARRTGIGNGADRDSAVVTGGATSRDTRVIERPVRVELHEAASRVAIAAFLRRDEVILRFASGDDAIVTSAAVAEDFAVIDEAGDVEA